MLIATHLLASFHPIVLRLSVINKRYQAHPIVICDIYNTHFAHIHHRRFGNAMRNMR